MACSIYYDDNGFVRLEFSGIFDASDGGEIVREAAALLREKNSFRLLTDFRNATVRLSFGMVYNLPQMVRAWAGEEEMFIYQIKRALVTPARYFDVFHFYENVAVNRAQRLKVFLDMDEAKAWLLAEN
ncbi:MAG: hypothetical protein AABZ00_17650 [Chloroflexota bacterium]